MIISRICFGDTRERYFLKPLLTAFSFFKSLFFRTNPRVKYTPRAAQINSVIKYHKRYIMTIKQVTIKTQMTAIPACSNMLPPFRAYIFQRKTSPYRQLRKSRQNNPSGVCGEKNKIRITLILSDKIRVTATPFQKTY